MIATVTIPIIPVFLKFLPGPVKDWTPEILDSDASFKPERWDDPGPAICGAGQRLSSYMYEEFQSGHYTIRYSDAQMSTFAYEMGLVDFFTPMTADEVYTLSIAAGVKEAFLLSKNVKEMRGRKTPFTAEEGRNAIWHEWITESFSAFESKLDLPSGIEIEEQDVSYVGNGTFKVEIIDANLPYEEENYAPDYEPDYD